MSKKEKNLPRKLLYKLELLGRKLVRAVGPLKMEKKFSKPPIIIGGCGRSGTTLLLSVIGAHPNIFAFPDEIMAFFDWKQSKHGDCYPRRVDRLYRAALLNQIPNQVSRWCEKSPPNVRYFGYLLDYFEELKLIHIIRDGRDVMLSSHPKKPDEYWVEPERWVNDVRAGLKYKDHPQVLTVKYENLVLDYDATVQKICKFIGEKCAEELYSWKQYTNVRNNEAWSGSVKELYSISIKKWQREENQKRIAEVMKHEEVVELLKELDYELD